MGSSLLPIHAYRVGLKLYVFVLFCGHSFEIIIVQTSATGLLRASQRDPWVSHEIVASIPKVEHALIVNMAFPGVVLSRTHHQRRRITYRLAKDNSFARLCCLFVLSV